MEVKSLQITPPEGYEVDKENSTFERIVFKPIDPKPKSWEEFIKKHLNETSWGVHMPLPSKNMSEQIVAFCKLLCLRQEWIGDWKPEWTNDNPKYCVDRSGEKIIVEAWNHSFRPLTFPSHKMAKEFFNCFKDLLDQAKELL